MRGVIKILSDTKTSGEKRCGETFAAETYFSKTNL
jgi:hypothetical protein